MNVMCRFVAIAWMALFGLTQHVSAAVLYDNGPIKGTINAFTINFGFAVSDSFTLASPSTLTGVIFGVWSTPGDTMTSVDWAITNTPGVYPVTGTALVTNGAPFSPAADFGFGGQFTISQDSFSLPNVALAAGTYYLVLQNAVSVGGNGLFWDENDGPSTATGNDFDPDPIASESFQILGTALAAETPLPAALPLFATGLGALGLLGWRRKRKAAALTA
jgi:hypothetical protein